MKKITTEKWIEKINEYLKNNTAEYAVYRTDTIKNEYNWNTIAKQWLNLSKRNV